MSLEAMSATETGLATIGTTEISTPEIRTLAPMPAETSTHEATMSVATATMPAAIAIRTTETGTTETRTPVTMPATMTNPMDISSSSMIVSDKGPTRMSTMDTSSSSAIEADQGPTRTTMNTRTSNLIDLQSARTSIIAPESSRTGMIDPGSSRTSAIDLSSDPTRMIDSESSRARAIDLNRRGTSAIDLSSVPTRSRMTRTPRPSMERTATGTRNLNTPGLRGTRSTGVGGWKGRDCDRDARRLEREGGQGRQRQRERMDLSIARRVSLLHSPTFPLDLNSKELGRTLREPFQRLKALIADLRLPWSSYLRRLACVCLCSTDQTRLVRLYRKRTRQVEQAERVQRGLVREIIGLGQERVRLLGLAG
jgi:hypothetical protein